MLKHRYIKYLMLAILFGIGLGAFMWAWSAWFLFLVGSIWLAITAWGSLDVRSNYFTKVYYKGEAFHSQEYALTFDDGPTVHTEAVLNLLQAYQMKATFFCIGKQLEKYPELAKRILQEGHQLGNHTYTHSKNIGTFSTKEVQEEIACTDLIIKKLNNENNPIFRPAFGVTNPQIARACEALNKAVIGWSIRSLDTVIPDEQRILKRIIPRLAGGEIVLLHDTTERTVRVLEQLLIYSKEQNLRSVRIDRLLKINAHG